MQMHQLKLSHEGKKRRRIGRGGKRGTYSGRGIKGLGARAGGRDRPAQREILKKIPKLRGYRFKSFRPKPAIVTAAALERAFLEGDAVSPETLHKKGLVRRVRGRLPSVKVLGTGVLSKRLLFKNVTLSARARKISHVS